MLYQTFAWRYFLLIIHSIFLLSYDIIKAHGGELKVETKEARPDDRSDGVKVIVLHASHQIPYSHIRRLLLISMADTLK